MGSRPSRLAAGESTAQAVRPDRGGGTTRLGGMRSSRQSTRAQVVFKTAALRSRGFASLRHATVGSVTAWPGNLPCRRDGRVLSCVCGHPGALVARLGGVAHPTVREAWSARRPQWRSASGYLHQLFDQGYVTITPEYRLEVSPRLKEDYRNGRSYYPLHRSSVSIPTAAADAPSVDFLRWHNERVYRAT